MVLKICMLVNNSLVNDSRVFKQANTLGKAGYEVTVMGLRDNALPREEKKDFFKIKRVFDYDLDFSPNPIHQIKSLTQLWRSAIKENADIYHAHDLDTLAIGLLASKKSKAKLIYDSHELWWDRNISGNYKKIKKIVKYFWRIEERLLIKKVDRVLTVNQSIAQYLKKKYKLTHADYLLNCPETSSTDSEQENAKKNLRTVLYLGKLSEGRGLENLVLSAKYLKPNIQIAIYGNGKLKNTLLKMIKSNDLENVSFFDPVPPSCIINTAKKADIGVSPIQNTSLTHYFSSPNKVYEYLSAGLPILVSDLPELKKIVQEYAVGFIINPEDPKSIAQTINQVVSNSILLEQMHQETKKAVAEKYNWGKQAEKLISLYSSIIQK